MFALGLFGWFVPPAEAAPDIVSARITGGDFIAARDALAESIEEDGLVVGAVLAFGEMLARTRGEEGNPYRAAEIVQFCSSAIAAKMTHEDATQIAMCPMSVAVYITKAQPDIVVIAYRLPGQGGSAARDEATALLARLVKRAAELAGTK